MTGLPRCKLRPRRWRVPKRLHIALARLLAIGALLLAPTAPRADADGACPPPSPPVAQAEAAGDARDRGILWRIERDGRVSHLYGTIHIGRADWRTPGPRVRAALAASDSLALELDVFDADLLRRLAEGMRAQPGEAPPAALATRLQAQLAAACLPLAAMAPLAPAVQLATLMTLAARGDGLDPAFAIDTALAATGRELGIRVISLESPELQLALLRGDPRTADARLARGLDDLEAGRVRPLLLRVAQTWAQGDAGELARYEAWCACADTEAERAALRRLLDDRNPALADRIEALHAGGARVFAAVGALHLVGAHGLPALLAQRGFTLRRVEFAR